MKRARQVIMLGPTSAGKTQLLWAAHHSAQPTALGMAFNAPQGGAGIQLEDHIGGDESLREFVKTTAFDRGPGGAVRPTDYLRNVKFAISVEDQAYPDGLRAEFNFFDPKGGWVVTNPNNAPLTGPDDFAPGAELDTPTREAVFNPNAIIYCIPMTKVERELELDAFLKQVNLEALESVTLCITKYDSVFIDDPVLQRDTNGMPRTHFSFAYNRGFSSREIKNRLARSDVSQLVGRLKQIRNSKRGPPKEIKVMPVSAFGFVPGTGQANVRKNPFDGAYEMLTAVPDQHGVVSDEYPYENVRVFKSDAHDCLWAPFQAFEALLSVMFTTEQMRNAGSCVFRWDEVQPKITSG